MIPSPSTPNITEILPTLGLVLLPTLIIVVLVLLKSEQQGFALCSSFNQYGYHLRHTNKLPKKHTHFINTMDRHSWQEHGNSKNMAYDFNGERRAMN